MVKILEIKNYYIPMFGNARSLPYGDLVVTDGTSEKSVKILGDDGNQYFVFKRKRYDIRVAGTLYSPRYVIRGTIEDAAELLQEAHYKVEMQSETALRVFYRDETGEFTQISLCDDSRDGYYTIEGQVQNLTDWIKRGI